MPTSPDELHNSPAPFAIFKPTNTAPLSACSSYFVTLFRRFSFPIKYIEARAGVAPRAFHSRSFLDTERRAKQAYSEALRFALGSAVGPADDAVVHHVRIERRATRAFPLANDLRAGTRQHSKCGMSHVHRMRCRVSCLQSKGHHDILCSFGSNRQFISFVTEQTEANSSTHVSNMQARAHTHTHKKNRRVLTLYSQNSSSAAA